MVFVTKASGEKEAFSKEKLLTSIRRARIPHELEQEVLSHIEEKLYEGMPTSQVYQHIAEFLDTKNMPYHKARYRLKQAIMDLGPTGYPFEKFVSRLFQRQGYTTQTNQILSGKCISHEIDVRMSKNSVTTIVEAKFHNGSGIKTDVQVSLYTKARFDDVAAKQKVDNVLLITNTKATTDAVSFAHCVGMEIITWSYPEGKGLRELVEEYHLHPITSLSSLSQSQKQTLLAQDIVLCSELGTHKQALLAFGLSEEKIKSILDEAAFVCSTTAE